MNMSEFEKGAPVRAQTVAHYGAGDVAASQSTMEIAVCESGETARIASCIEHALLQVLNRLEGEKPEPPNETAPGKVSKYGGILGQFDATMTATRTTLTRCEQIIAAIRKHV